MAFRMVLQEIKIKFLMRYFRTNFKITFEMDMYPLSDANGLFMLL